MVYRSYIMYVFSKRRYSVNSIHSRKVPLLNNNNQQAINIAESGDVMKLFKYDVLQELNTIHMN